MILPGEALQKQKNKQTDFLSSYDVDRLKNRKKNCANEWLRELRPWSKIEIRPNTALPHLQVVPRVAFDNEAINDSLHILVLGCRNGYSNILLLKCILKHTDEITIHLLRKLCIYSTKNSYSCLVRQIGWISYRPSFRFNRKIQITLCALCVFRWL